MIVGDIRRLTISFSVLLLSLLFYQSTTRGRTGVRRETLFGGAYIYIYIRREMCGDVHSWSHLYVARIQGIRTPLQQKTREIDPQNIL